MAKKKNSAYYQLIKTKYDKGEWTKQMLRLLVSAGRITAAEYETITGEAF